MGLPEGVNVIGRTLDLSEFNEESFNYYLGQLLFFEIFRSLPAMGTATGYFLSCGQKSIV